MSDGNTKSDMRRHERVGFAESVSLEFEAGPVSGSGENISLQGIYFTTDSPIRVRVKVKDGSTLAGELVRAESIGDGRVGIAVRFLEPNAGLIAD